MGSGWDCRGASGIGGWCWEWTGRGDGGEGAGRVRRDQGSEGAVSVAFGDSKAFKGGRCAAGCARPCGDPFGVRLGSGNHRMPASRAKGRDLISTRSEASQRRVRGDSEVTQGRVVVPPFQGSREGEEEGGGVGVDPGRWSCLRHSRALGSGYCGPLGLRALNSIE